MIIYFENLTTESHIFLIYLTRTSNFVSTEHYLLFNL